MFYSFFLEEIMDFEFTQLEKSAAKEARASDEVASALNNENIPNSTRYLQLFASFFPIPKKAFNQKSNNKEGDQNLHAEEFSNAMSMSSCSRSSSSSLSSCSERIIDRTINSSKRGPKPHLDQKAKLQ